MAYNFPDTPNINDTYAPPGGPAYRWDGVAWTIPQTEIPDTSNTIVTQLPTGGFAENNVAWPPRVHRMADRLYLGDGVGLVGNWPTPSGLDPVTNKLHGWAPREATVWCDAPNGGMSIVGHAQRSKKLKPGITGYTSPTGFGIGVSGFAINDGIDAISGPAAGGYFEAVRFNGGGFTVGAEIEVANFGGWVPMNPFNVKASGGTGTTGNGPGVALWLGASAGLDAVGYDGSLGTPNDVAGAITMVSSHATNDIRFGKGIVIATGALRDLSGGSNVYGAFDMPPAHQISWYRLAGVTPEQSAYIWESGTSAGQVVMGMKFGSDGITLRAGTAPIARFVHAAAVVNNLVFSPAATGGNPSIIAEGTDADINMVLRPKGTRGVLLQGADAATRIQVSSSGIGFHAATPVARPTISGTRSANAALASLLTQLAGYGLITDSTTAGTAGGAVEWADITGKPTTFPPTVPIAWTDLSGVPATFAPSAHNHPQSEVTSLVTDLAAKEPTITAGTSGQYWQGTKSWQTLDKAAVGLANVDNTADSAKPVSTLQAAADALNVLKTGDTMSGVLNFPIGAVGTPSIAIGNTTTGIYAAAAGQVGVTTGGTVRLNVANAAVVTYVPARVLNSTATPAGGTAGSGIQLGTTTNFGIFFGSGAPTLTAAQGSLYLRSDGSSNVTRLYVNTTGSTVWTACNTVA